MASISGSRGGGRSRGGGGGGRSGMFSRDVAWKYCSPVEGNQNWTICIRIMDDDDDEDEEVYMYLVDMHPDDIALNIANSYYFKNMIIGAQQVGMGIEPPSPYEIKNKYLEMEYKDMEAYVNQQRENG
ncbi:hypothetical protein CK203_064399 [Vitis vinifera]|uniref:Uncharacterized protein n=1 Tax=Vitis vinifera TaxID=29760 RepID=A0A438G4B5_VITVI|nr:hypothetical protein CK203_064399 [Vitis vinifera]